MKGLFESGVDFDGKLGGEGKKEEGSTGIGVWEKSA